MTSNERSAIAIVVLGGIAILAALWILAISPKRADSAEVRDNVATQQERLSAAQAQLATFESAHKQFPGMLAELKSLDKAVPARAAISSLLRQLQRRANVRDSQLRLVSLKTGSQAAAPAAAGAAPVAPGATAGPAGLSALPFTFEFNGKYFDLRDILATVRRSVRVKAGDVKVNGRLLTIDGLTFTPNSVASGTTETKAVISATAYIAPDGAATPQPPATAAAATTAGGS
jgi:Tfp pilus assembly protein PilO